MPIYEYVCETNGCRFDRLGLITEVQPDYLGCENGCGNAKRQVVPTSSFVDTFRPYTDIHMTGKPIEITSRAQKRSLLKANGKVEVGNDFVDRSLEREVRRMSALRESR